MTRNWKVSYLNIFKFNLPDKLKDILISDITAIWISHFPSRIFKWDIKKYLFEDFDKYRVEVCGIIFQGNSEEGQDRWL